MSIEDTLERIATALEKIAGGAEHEITTDPVARQRSLEAAASAAKKATDEIKDKQGAIRTDKTEATKTRPGKKVEERKEETNGNSFYEIEEELVDPEQIKWPDLNKKLFGMLEEVRSVLGQDEAKAICATLMKKYSGGQKFTEGAVKPGLYKALLTDIEEQLEALSE